MILLLAPIKSTCDDDSDGSSRTCHGIPDSFDSILSYTRNIPHQQGNLPQKCPSADKKGQPQESKRKTKSELL